MILESCPLACDIIYPDDIDLNKKYCFGIVIMVRNRSHFVKQCFESLRKTRLKDSIILIIDDVSTESESIRLVKEFSMPDVPVVKIFLKQHRHFMIHENIRFGCDLLLEKYQLSYLITLDSDTVQKPEWLEKLYELYRFGKDEYGHMIVSGFNSCVSHIIIRRYKGYYVKRCLGGVNLFFDREIYYSLVRENLKLHWDCELCSSMRRAGYPYLVTSPSVVQHRGNQGLFSVSRCYDFSLDYSSRDSIRLFPIYIYMRLMCISIIRSLVVWLLSKTVNVRSRN